jgi:hypothetical protein
VRVVERADVVGDADLLERDLPPGLLGDCGHAALLLTAARPAGAPIPAHPHARQRAILGWRVGASAAGVLGLAHRLVEDEHGAQLIDRGVAELRGDRDELVRARRAATLGALDVASDERSG